MSVTLEAVLDFCKKSINNSAGGLVDTGLRRVPYVAKVIPPSDFVEVNEKFMEELSENEIDEKFLDRDHLMVNLDTSIFSKFNDAISYTSRIVDEYLTRGEDDPKYFAPNKLSSRSIYCLFDKYCPNVFYVGSTNLGDAEKRSKQHGGLLYGGSFNPESTSNREIIYFNNLRNYVTFVDLIYYISDNDEQKIVEELCRMAMMRYFTENRIPYSNINSKMCSSMFVFIPLEDLEAEEEAEANKRIAKIRAVAEEAEEAEETEEVEDLNDPDVVAAKQFGFARVVKISKKRKSKKQKKEKKVDLDKKMTNRKSFRDFEEDLPMWKLSSEESDGATFTTPTKADYGDSTKTEKNNDFIAAVEIKTKEETDAEEEKKKETDKEMKKTMKEKYLKQMYYHHRHNEWVKPTMEMLRSIEKRCIYCGEKVKSNGTKNHLLLKHRVIAWYSTALIFKSKERIRAEIIAILNIKKPSSKFESKIDTIFRDYEIAYTVPLLGGPNKLASDCYKLRMNYSPQFIVAAIDKLLFSDSKINLAATRASQVPEPAIKASMNKRIFLNFDTPSDKKVIDIFSSITGEEFELQNEDEVIAEIKKEEEESPLPQPSDDPVSTNKSDLTKGTKKKKKTGTVVLAREAEEAVAAPPMFAEEELPGNIDSSRIFVTMADRKKKMKDKYSSIIGN